MAALVVRLSASADTLSATSFSWWEALPAVFPGASFSRASRFGFQPDAGIPPVRLKGGLKTGGEVRLKPAKVREVLSSHQLKLVADGEPAEAG